MKRQTNRICVVVLIFALMVGIIPGLHVRSEAAAKKPKLSTKKVTVNVNSTKKVTVKNAKNAKISWKVKSKKVATIKKSGKYATKIKGKKAGKTTVTATVKLRGKKYSFKCSVTVKKKSTSNDTAESKDEQSTPTASPAGTAKPGAQQTAVPTTVPTKVPTQPTVTPTKTPVPAPTVDPNFTPVDYQVSSFESGTDGFVRRGGNEVLASVAGGYSGNCLSVSGRTASWNGASLDVTDSISKCAVYKITAWLKQTSGETQTMKVSATLTTGSSTTYPAIGEVSVPSGQWTKFEGLYAVPKSFTNLAIYFESSANTFDFLLDELSIVQVSEGMAVVDPMTLPSLKEAYSSLFTNVGTCLNCNGWSAGGQMQDSNTMNFVKKQFNSFTLENDMKPDAILGSTASTITKTTASGSAYNYVFPSGYTETNVPKLNFDAVDKAMKIAYDSGIRMRAHTLMWHQQTPSWFFKTNYSDSGSKVSTSVMDARLEFYVRTVMKHVMDKEKEIAGSAGTIVYAWDVANEYIHRDNNPTGTSWMDVYGNQKLEPKYLKDAFTYAYDMLTQYNVQNTVGLFYNDYNTYDVTNDVISLINYINSSKKICRGIGMQSHLDVERPTIEAYNAALTKFKNAGFEIQITELDVTIKFSGSTKYTDDDQAQYLSDLMKVLIEQKKSGANITGITFWGLYDSISWRASDSPLLFGTGINDPKPSFYSVLAAVKEQ